MGSLPRNEIAGATYHVVARGVDRRRIFVDDEDYEAYTEMLGAVVRRQGWHLLCYCLMPNHVHLMIETPETNLARGVQLLHSRHAIRFNRRHERTGHLFEAPFKSPLVATDEAFVQTVGYIVVNPVAAVLAKRARDWKWGSHPLAGEGRSPSWLAHERVEERLEAFTGVRCYDALVAAHERALLTRSRKILRGG